MRFQLIYTRGLFVIHPVGGLIDDDKPAGGAEFEARLSGF
jgi:hypothetical protein